MEGGPAEQRLTEIAIVGAGMAGAALAIACHQAGMAVRVYDRAESRPGAPRLIELTANGTRVLNALGLKERLAAIARYPSFATLRSSRTGFLLGQRPLGPFSESRYGAACCLVRHETLRQLLRETVRRLGIPMEAPVTVTDVNTATATIALADGRRIAHRAVAVAAGRSRPAAGTGLCALLEPRDWTVPQDVTVIHATATRSAVDREHGRFINTWLGSGFALLERPDIGPDPSSQPLELTLVARRERGDETAEAALQSLLAICHPHLGSLASDLEDVVYVDARTASVVERWQAGRVALLGSLCHAAPPYPAIEPSVVLEDAWILSRMMERWEDEPHRGFPDYERFRASRAARLRRHSERELASHTLTDGLPRWQRNLGWSLSSRFLPEIALEKLDWLYGYDCIRGFA